MVMNSRQKYIKHVFDYSTTFHAFNKVQMGFDYVRVCVFVCVCVCVPFNISSTI
jgi:hypothetical protein